MRGSGESIMRHLQRRLVQLCICELGGGNLGRSVARFLKTGCDGQTDPGPDRVARASTLCLPRL